MLLFDGGFALLALAVWLFCIIDVITTPDDQVRNLPKLVWLLLVVILVDIGSIAWLVAGRNWNARSADPSLRRAGRSRVAGPASRVPSNPDDDEEFLARLRARAEEQRRRAREGEPTDHDGDQPTA